MFSRHWMILVLMALGFGLSACTRATQDNTSKMAIQLPSKMQSNKVGSLALTSTDQLVHVSINVTGADMPAPVVLQWDSKGGDTTAVTGPTSFPLEIPMGSNRLIQVLAVYQNSNTHSMTFYYGDVLKTLSVVDEPPVTIAISQLGQSLDVLTGQVAGRILTAANEGPTGMVDVKFNPGGGKPSLIVERTHIISGWMSVFMLSGVSLDYILSATGASLFGGPVSLDSPQFAPSQQVLKIAIPIHVGEEYSGMVKVKTTQDAEIDVWGYWSFNGTDISGKAICNGMAASAFSTLKVYNPVPTNATTILGYTLLGAGGAFPANAALLSATTIMPNLIAKGGILSTAAPCSSFNSTTDPVNNFMTVLKKSIDGYGNDQMAGFRNIYRISSSANGGSAIAIVPSATASAVSGQVLPGVNALFNGIKFFKRVGVSGQNFHIEKPICTEIAAGSLDFVGAGEVTAIAADGTFSGSIDVTSANFSSGNVAIVACPSKNGVLGPLGYFTNMSSGGAGGSSPANGFMTKMDWGKILTSQCHEVQIDLTYNGSAFGVTNSAGVTFNAPSGTVGAGYSMAFFSDSSCTNSLASNFSIPANSTHSSIYLLLSGGSGAQSGAVNITTTAFAGMTKSAPFFVDTTSGATSLALNRDGLFLGSDCQSFDIFFTNGLGFSGVWSGTLSYTVPAALGLYTDQSCTTSAPAGSIGISSFKQTFFVKRLSGLGQSMITFSGLSGSKNLYIDPAPLVDHLSLALGGANYLGDCVSASVTAKDINNVAIAPSAAFIFQASGTGVQFYTDAGCSVFAGPLTMPVGGVYTPIYAKFSEAGAFSASATSMFAMSLSAPVVGTVALPLLFSEGTSYPYGSITANTSSAHIFTITNAGTGTVTSLTQGTVPANYAFTGGSFPGTGGTCGSPLSGSASCTISVTFTPTVAGTTYSGPLVLNYYLGGSQALTIYLTGMGI